MNIYNRITDVIDCQAKRDAIIKSIWPDGFPTQTATLNFSADSNDYNLVNRHRYNRRVVTGAAIDMRIKSSYRYCHPTSGTLRDEVLIWLHGHDSFSNLGYAYQYISSIPFNGAHSHAQRVQFHYLPSNVTNAAWRLPLTSGIGVLEASGLLGMYLNSIGGNFVTITDAHTDYVNTLGMEAIGHFLTPVIIAINTVVAAGKIPVLGGFSGGGWATLLVAALDPRVKLSFVHSGYTGVISDTIGAPATAVNGDGEQYLPELYTIANAHELAVMGCADGGEAHHIWNSTEGTGADPIFPMTAANYKELLSNGLIDAAAKQGGSLQLWGFNGLNDPCTNFGATGTATYTTIANAVTSAQVSDPFTGAFSYQGNGHHIMQQGIDLMVSRILGG